MSVALTLYGLTVKYANVVYTLVTPALSQQEANTTFTTELAKVPGSVVDMGEVTATCSMDGQTDLDTFVKVFKPK